MEDFVQNIVQSAMGTSVDTDGDLFLAGLDSLGVLKIISFIEKEYEIEIDDEDLTMDNMRTVGSICKMIKKYQ